MKEKIYLPGLNGIRAIAALFVLFSHVNSRFDYFLLPKGKQLDLSIFGVTIFFTLSGFLITYLLLKEKEINGIINMKSFYMRRILRIWPLYFGYLLITVLVNGIDSVKWPFLFILFIIPNFRNSFAGVTNIGIGSANLSQMVGHYWSLGVEEQFYAFWPWIIEKSKRLLLFLIVFPLFFILLKVVLRISNAPSGIITFFNYTRFGCMAIGALGAYLYFNKNNKFKQLFEKKWIEASAWLLLLIVALNKFHITSIIDHEIISIVTLVIIINQIGNPNKMLNLENKVFDYLGQISYGLYIFHPLVIYWMSFLINQIGIENKSLKQFIIYLTVFAGTVIIAHFSYHNFEKRFLKLKTRYTTIQTAPSKSEFQTQL